MSQMPQLAACPSCEEPLESGDRFCGACGYDLSAVPVPPDDHPTITMNGAAPRASSAVPAVDWPVAPEPVGSDTPASMVLPTDLEARESAGSDGPGVHLAAPAVRPDHPPQPSTTPHAQRGTGQPPGPPQAQRPAGRPAAPPRAQSAGPASASPRSQQGAAPRAKPSGPPSAAPQAQPTVAPQAQPPAAPHAAPTAHPPASPHARPTGPTAAPPRGGPAMPPHPQPSVAPHGGPATAPQGGRSTAPHGGSTPAPHGGPAIPPHTQPSVPPHTQPSVPPHGGPSAPPYAGAATPPDGGPAAHAHAQPPSRVPGQPPSHVPGHAPGQANGPASAHASPHASPGLPADAAAGAGAPGGAADDASVGAAGRVAAGAAAEPDEYPLAAPLPPEVPAAEAAPEDPRTADLASPPAGLKVCVACRAGQVDRDGYCENCGHAQPRERDHMEQELGAVAAVSDRGLRHHRNEDAFTVSSTALPDGSPAVVAIVCDGVSSATRPDEASLAASRAAGESLMAALPRGTHPQQAMHDAILTAAEAVNSLADRTPAAPEHQPHINAPACTIVGAVVTPSLLIIGWIGDSRAYWVPVDRSSPPARLTEDDSWAAQMVAAGLMTEAEAYADDRAHAITGWLGADAYELEPHTASFKPDRPGVVVVCTDGLWNYAEGAEEMAEVIPPDAAERPLHSAQVLVGHALDGGGHDNVTVAVLPFPAPQQGAGSA